MTASLMLFSSAAIYMAVGGSAIVTADARATPQSKQMLRTGITSFIQSSKFSKPAGDSQGAAQDGTEKGSSDSMVVRGAAQDGKEMWLPVGGLLFLGAAVAAWWFTHPAPGSSPFLPPPAAAGPLCQRAGCGKPTWNRQPGEYCSKSCRSATIASPVAASSLAARMDATALPPPQLAGSIVDSAGWSLDLHAEGVLSASPAFKGAIWVAMPPQGVTMWHNSGFSNWYQVAAGFTVVHDGETYTFSNSESVIMAVKEKIGAVSSFKDCLAKHAKLDAKTSKDLVAKVNAYPLWDSHAFQVLVGAAACLLKFAQDAPLERVLNDTGETVLIETAPNDGSWGVAKNSQSFLDTGELPAHYKLESTEATQISFAAGSRTFSRPRRKANSLGKALTLVRAAIKSGGLSKVRANPTLAVGLEVAVAELGRVGNHGLEALGEALVDVQKLIA